jgi:hypothetical protein
LFGFGSGCPLYLRYAAVPLPSGSPSAILFLLGKIIHSVTSFIFQKNFIIRFIRFVKDNVNQDDPALKSFAKYVLTTKEFPLSSDPRYLALNLCKKLNHLQTKGYQMYMILYRQTESTNQLSEDLKNNERAFLEAVNTIVNLQNNDPDYKDF